MLKIKLPLLSVFAIVFLNFMLDVFGVFSYNTQTVLSIIVLGIVLAFDFFMLVLLWRKPERGTLTVVTLFLIVLGVFATNSYANVYGGLENFKFNVSMRVVIIFSVIIYALYWKKGASQLHWAGKSFFLLSIVITILSFSKLLNIVADTSVEITQSFEIYEKYFSNLEGRSFHFKIASKEFGHIIVDESTFDRFKKGDRIPLRIKQGAFGEPWISKID